MKRSCLDISLIDDNRAVAPLIGFILLFGFLTIAFTGYQAQVVPQQNAETEFEHFQQNHNEMIELRSAILTAGSSDRPQFPTIKLGTNYQTRILAINGPPPSGLLQTSDPYPITISDSDTEVVVETRFLEYQPGYYEIDIGSTWYENSVLYLDEPESSEPLIIEDQSLVTDGDTLRITALQNDFQRSGTNRITLELYPTSVEGDISDLADNEELSVELPTRLSSDYWEGQFIESSSVTYNDNEFEDSEFGPEVNKLTLTVNSVANIEINTVGIREEPTGSPAKNIQSQTDGSGGSGGDPLPSGSNAFNDINGNGVFDDGIDETYFEDDIKDFDDDEADLIIEKDISHTGNWDIEAKSITVRDGVTVESENNDLTLSTDDGGSINVQGATLKADKDLTLSTDDGGNINAQGSTLTAGEKLELSTDDGGDINAQAATLTAGDDLTLTVGNSGNIDLQDAILESDEEIEANLGDGTLTVNEDSGNGGTRIRNSDGGSATLIVNGGSREGEVKFGEIND